VKENVRILRNGNLTDLVSIDVVDGRRKGKNDIASRAAGRKYGSHNIDIIFHVRSHYHSRRRVAELVLRIHQEHEEG